MKSKHEIKSCARCGTTFECKLNNPVHCDCAEVTLLREVAEEIYELYGDCICPDCLKAISLDPDSL